MNKSDFGFSAALGRVGRETCVSDLVFQSLIPQNGRMDGQTGISVSIYSFHVSKSFIVNVKEHL